MDASSGTLRNQIDYITIGSTGNATDFGDLTVATEYCKGASGTTRGTITGGNRSGSGVNVIETIYISSSGNATDFGDLTSIRRYHGSASSGHAGCQ